MLILQNVGAATALLCLASLTLILHRWTLIPQRLQYIFLEANEPSFRLLKHLMKKLTIIKTCSNPRWRQTTQLQMIVLSVISLSLDRSDRLSIWPFIFGIFFCILNEIVDFKGHKIIARTLSTAFSIAFFSWQAIKLLTTQLVFGKDLLINISICSALDQVARIVFFTTIGVLWRIIGRGKIGLVINQYLYSQQFQRGQIVDQNQQSVSFDLQNKQGKVQNFEIEDNFMANVKLVPLNPPVSIQEQVVISLEQREPFKELQENKNSPQKRSPEKENSPLKKSPLKSPCKSPQKSPKRRRANKQNQQDDQQPDSNIKFVLKKATPEKQMVENFSGLNAMFREPSYEQIVLNKNKLQSDQRTDPLNLRQNRIITEPDTIQLDEMKSQALQQRDQFEQLSVQYAKEVALDFQQQQQFQLDEIFLKDDIKTQQQATRKASDFYIADVYEPQNLGSFASPSKEINLLQQQIQNLKLKDPRPKALSNNNILPNKKTARKAFHGKQGKRDMRNLLIGPSPYLQYLPGMLKKEQQDKKRNVKGSQELKSVRRRGLVRQVSNQMAVEEL